MGVTKILHKIKMVFVRKREKPLPSLSEEKMYGNDGEEDAAQAIKKRLRKSEIKKNVIINSSGGKAEIDLLVLYDNKLFAIEVKHWKGAIYEQEDGSFLQVKSAQQKLQKSPFKQLDRAVYLLKKQIRHQVWINKIVLFIEADEAYIQSDEAWFGDINDMIKHIKHYGIESAKDEANLFFGKCNCADIIYGEDDDRSLACVISKESLRFQTKNGIITKKDISAIKISHHLTYDKLKIFLKDGSVIKVVAENQKIFVKEGDGSVGEYALCKLDYIQLGDYI